MTKRYKIGIMDSGIGGLSVLSTAKKMLSNCDFFYYADTDNVPYGTKTPSEIKLFTRNAISFLAEKSVDAVIIACNTATSIAVEDMRREFTFPIIGMEPAVKSAYDIAPGGEILVCATPVTISGIKLQNLIKRLNIDPDLIAMPELVNYAENSVFDDSVITDYLKRKIKEPLKYEAVVLGCTHFSYFKKAFNSVFTNAEIVDGNKGTVKRTAELLNIDIFKSNYNLNNITLYFKSGRSVSSDTELDFFNSLENRII